MAEEAIAMADGAARDLKERYLVIAEEFTRLATDLEVKSRHHPDNP
jgi:hypothetical protein